MPSSLSKKNWYETTREFYKYLIQQGRSPKTALDYALVIQNYIRDYEEYEYGYKNIIKFSQTITDTKYNYKFALIKYVEFLKAKKHIDKKLAKKLIKFLKNIKVRTKQRREKRTLTKEQYNQLLKYIIQEKDIELLLAILLAYDTGARITAIIRLKKKDFYYDDEYKVWKVMLEEKGGKRIPSFVSDRTMKLLKKYTQNMTDDTYIFIPDKKKLNIHILEEKRFDLLGRLKRIAKKYLKMKTIGFHYIRRLAGLEIYKATGNNIVAVQQYFKHTSPEITARYLKLDEEDILKAWKKRFGEKD